MADHTAAIKLLAPDFHFLLEDEDVPAALQAKVAESGVTTLRLFAHLADDAKEFKLCLKNDFELDPAADLPTRLNVARLTVAWEAARKRQEVRQEQKAVAAAQQLPELLAKGEHLELRRAFTKAYYEAPEATVPSDSYVEFRFDQIEQGELRAESLTKATSREDKDDEPIETTVERRTGVIRVKTGTSPIPLPQDPEELRTRIRIVGHCWLITKIKFPNKAWLQTVTPQLFVNYIDHLLGEHLWGLHVRGPGGVILASPQWAQLLEYEFRVRKAMSRTINEGGDFNTALVQAMNCPITRDRYFTSPAAMSSSLRLPPASGPPLQQQAATQDWSA